MIAETVYPIVRALSRAEQVKLFEQLEKDLQNENEIMLKEMTPKEKRKAERMKWLKANVFYAPKY